MRGQVEEATLDGRSRKRRSVKDGPTWHVAQVSGGAFWRYRMSIGRCAMAAGPCWSGGGAEGRERRPLFADEGCR